MIDVNKLVTIHHGACPEGDKPLAAMVGKRQNIIGLLEAVLTMQWERKLPDRGFTVTMPCGYERNFREPNDIPMETLPCPCGKPELIMEICA